MKHGIVSAIAGGVLSATAAYAAPITGEISVNGPDTFTSSQINFTGLGNLQGDTGSFVELGTCTLCVNMAAALNAGTSGQLFSVSNLGNTATLNITAPNTVIFTPNAANPALDALEIEGSGSLSLTGFDTTSGVYTMTTQGPQLQDVTWSATATPVATPEPGTLAILAAALAGLWWLGRRRFAAVAQEPEAI